MKKRNLPGIHDPVAAVKGRRENASQRGEEAELRAQRQNEDAARAHCVSTTRFPYRVSFAFCFRLVHKRDDSCWPSGR